MADLVHGRYPVGSPFWNILGQAVNASDASVPVQTNLSFLGMASAADTAGALTSGKVTSVAVPVDNGTVISKISVVVGATAAGTPTHGFACLYSGTSTPTLAVQSVDTGSGAVAASAVYTWTLPAPVLVSYYATAATTTSTLVAAPNGFIYVGLSETASTVASLAAASVAAAIGYQWTGLNGTNTPLGFALSHGSSVGATAPTTIASSAAQAAVPFVFLQ